MLARSILVSLALVATLATGALALTRTVRLDGSGDFLAIQPALDASASGDTVRVFDGVYAGSENRNLSFFGRDIVLLSDSDDPAACVIDCEGGPVYQQRGFVFGDGESDAAVVRGFTVQGAYVTGSGAAFYIEASGLGTTPAVRIENCIATGNTAASGAGLVVIGKATPRVIDCRFTGNEGGGALWTAPQMWQTAGASLVENCTFDGNTGDGVTMQGTGYFPFDEYLRFRHCTFSDNTGRGIRHDNVYGVVKLDTCQIRDNDDWGITLISEGELPERGAQRLPVEDWIALTRCDVTGNGAGGVQAFSEFEALIDCVVSDNRGPGFADQFGSFGTHIVGCSFEDNDDHGVNVHGYAIDFHDNVARRNGLYGARVDWGDGVAVDIHDNLVQDNGTDGLIVNVRYDYASDVTLGNNVISRNGGNGVTLMGDPFLLPCILTSNTIAHNTLAGIDCQTPVELRLTSTVVAFNDQEALAGSFAPTTDLDCSDLYGNLLGDYTGDLILQLGADGNISANPMFCDPAGGIYTIHALSPGLDGNHPDGFACGDIGALSFGCPPPHAGGDWNVSMDGDDYFGDGTGGAPFATIQQAIDLAAHGDTIVVGTGTYTGDGNRDLNLGGKDLVIRSASENPADCVIDCQGEAGDEHRGFVFSGEETSATLLCGFTIVNGWVTDDGGGILVQSSGTDALPAPRIERCVVSGSTAGRGAGLAVIGPAAPQVSDCSFVDNFGHGVAIAGTEVAAGFQFTTSLIAGNTQSGLLVDLPTPPVWLTLAGLTIADNGGHGIECAQPVCVDLSASIVAYNGQRALVGHDTTVDLDCVDFFGNTGGDFVDDLAIWEGQQGNISADPWFCDRPGGDYAVFEISPCADGQHPDGADCGTMGAVGIGCLALPVITEVSDVGNDQGRQVRLFWNGTDLDQLGSPTPITAYGVYRQQDDAAPPLPGLRRDLSLPLPGWDFLMTVPARGDSAYQYVAATLCDSTSAGICWSTFMVSAMTDDPYTYFDSDPAQGYSVDNIVPPAPPGFTVEYRPDNYLTWEAADAPDLAWYNVYRGETEDFVPGEENLVAQVVETYWTDDGVDWGVFYRVSAVDDATNESEIVSPFHLVTVSADVPAVTGLEGNAPNPFNPATTIGFSLASDLAVSLRVYDLTGRLVRTLVPGEVLTAGRHEAVWRGRDDRGQAVASGMYLYRLQAGDVVETRRMALVK